MNDGATGPTGLTRAKLARVLTTLFGGAALMLACIAAAWYHLPICFVPPTGLIIYGFAIMFMYAAFGDTDE